MKIISMEAENFKAYSRRVLPEKGSFGQGLFLINGKNSMGKTSLIQCVLWGLLGDGLMDVQENCCSELVNHVAGSSSILR